MALGWRAARQRRFDDHRIWMWRNYLMLCSTVILRVNGGIGALLGINGEWFYAQSAWTSWMVPLAIFEFIRLAGRKHHRPVMTAISTTVR
jgi:hypothetical protein